MAKNYPGYVLIRDALISDAGSRRGVKGDILIKDGIIAEMGPDLAAPDGANIVDASGMLVHAGLVNAHTHGHGGLGRGQGDRWTLEVLLAAAPWISGSRSLQDKKLTTQICAAEMVLKGCTAAYDLYYEYPAPSIDGMDAVAEAYAEVGMRAVIAPMVADHSFYEAIPGLRDALPEDLQHQVDRLRLGPGDRTISAIGSILERWKWSSHDIRPAVAPTIPIHCSDSFMCGCAKLARDHGIPLQSHVGESKVQAVVGKERYGKTLIAHLDELGLINEQFSAAHAVWLDDDDFRLMADRGASLAHNAGSNMRLGNGLFRMRRALDLGVNVGIGTDGANCSDNQNMYEAMRYASMASKVQGPDPRKWAAVEEIYYAATAGSARALGLSHTGVLAPGYKADIVFLDLGAINWIPHNWSVNQLVHTEDATSVRHVMIGGSFVVRDGRLLTLDMARLAREAEAARDRLEILNAEWRGLFERLEPVVASFCPGLAARPYQINRYLCDEVE
ncbi:MULTISPECIES: amidohydrolase family protein [Tardiphaga]|jgi:5-methylthioadenosine/S-adenosylhomocysteine deaminase|uniref:amidohydrolase family protein n=1 Tax=Tardiphaga TaxID=1395974 RepID=UPI0008A76FAA|nr:MULTISPECIES: amidohydrolase family protein [Tardiphaga]MDR6663532.1 guanine deaminase [Tardiphaga robiniae]SEH43728.1 Cytosine/adenosine deaminase [Tardiphaga sp. OK245]